MKNNLFLYIIAVFFIYACQDNRLEGMYNDSIYFVKNGKQEVSGYLSDDEIVLQVPIYRSGIAKDPQQVLIEIDPTLLSNYENVDGENFNLLPAANYTLNTKEISLEGDSRQFTATVVIDIKKLHTIQGVADQKYALPLRLKSNAHSVEPEQSEMVIVPVLTGGFRPDSQEIIWSKTFTELGINNTDHFTASLGVSSKFVFVNTRSADLRYYDRFTGDFKGSIALPFKGSLDNFTITNDEADNLLITNLRNQATGLARQSIYKISGLNQPELFIDIEHQYPNGRKMSIVGDLNKDALISSGVENSSKILIWRVEGGKLRSQMPEVIELDPSKIMFRLFGDAIPLSLNLEDGMFVLGNGNISAFGYFNKAGNLLGEISLNQLGIPAQNNNNSNSIACIDFNGSKYVAVATQSSPSMMLTTLLDLTSYRKLDRLSTPSLIAYQAAPMQTNNNANYTVDVQLRLADDSTSFMMYSLGTNGSIVATKFTN